MIAIGVGGNTRATTADFAAAIADIIRDVGGADVVATFDVAPFGGLLEQAAMLQSLRYAPMSLESLRARNGECKTRSMRTLELFGVASVAEAAALAATGQGSRLVAARRVIGPVTIAAAQSEDQR